MTKFAPSICYLCVAAMLLPARDPAAKQPHAIHSDQRIKQIAYDPNRVTEIVGTYGYVTTIEFAPDEIITGRTFGDSIAWQTLIRGNHLYLKPVEPQASGNMIVVTDKRTYLFKLDSSVADMTYLVRFKYPALMAGADQNDSGLRSAPMTNNSFNPAAINLNYAAAGQKSAIQLLRVFDDGQFTYFEFGAGTDIPAIYFVESDGTESSVNLHRDGAYLVAERTARMFTLRNGPAHLCVENASFGSARF